MIVLCAGCSDGAPEALRGLGSTCLEAVELPRASATAMSHRNRALERADSNTIVWLADDDLLMADLLERIGELWDTGRYDIVQSHA